MRPQLATELTAHDVAKALGVQVTAVYVKIRSGEIYAEKLPSNAYKITSAELERILRPKIPRKSIFRDFEITPGGLTDADRDRIFELAAEEGMKAWTIARKIGKHPSTVSWFMLQNGLKKKKDGHKKPFYRGEDLIVPYSVEEDAFITTLRKEGLSPGKIAERYPERFTKQRSRKSISFRLSMLASHELMLEEAA